MFVVLNQGAHPALLVESQSSPGVSNADSIGILVQQRGKTGWTSIGTIEPRREFETSAIDAPGADTLKLIFLHSYGVRSIGQLMTAEIMQPQAVQLAGATHSRLGSVQDSVGTADGNSTTLVRGDELTLSAHVTPPAGGMARDAFLLSTGGFRQPVAAVQKGLDLSSRPQVARPVWHFALGAAHPNPSMGTVTIEYTLAQQSPVSIRVYDVAGRLVKALVSGTGTPGPHDVTWNASNDDGRKVGAGVYFYRMEAGTWRSQRKLVFLEH